VPDWLHTFLAGLPILTILVLMVGLRWRAASAGTIGLLITFAIAWLAFGYGTRVLPELGVTVATAGALLEAAFITLTVLWIIFPALCIHQLQLRTGAIDELRFAMGRLSHDPRITALLVGWFFALFMEGAAGFGTAVALAAPFLVSAGFKRVEAVSMALIGHSVGVSFGAVGTPILPQLAVTQFGAVELSAATGIYHTLVGWLIPLMAVALVQAGLPQEKRPDGILWSWTLFAAALFFAPYYLIANFIGPELPTLGGALFGVLAFTAALLVYRKRAHATVSQVRSPSALALPQAAAPYLILVGLVLLTRLVPALRNSLTAVTLHWQFEVFSGSMQVLYHPGTMLFLSLLAGAVWQRASLYDFVGALRNALRQVLPVTLALLTMLSISRLLVHAGMIETLASSAAATLGLWWPLFAPFVGTLGTFVTGSATASNILFTEFQHETAERLGLSALALLGAQGFGAAVGNIICPHNIIAAGATVELSGREGEILRRTAAVALFYTVVGGFLALLVFA
jgi:lactate permease